jgi:hypothetical protein
LVVGAKKRQTMGKLMRERERAEKRARKQEKKDARKAAAAGIEDVEAAGIPFTPPPEGEGEGEASGIPFTPAPEGEAEAANGEPVEPVETHR